MYKEHDRKGDGIDIGDNKAGGLFWVGVLVFTVSSIWVLVGDGK